MSSSANLNNKTRAISSEEKIFGPPFAYYKDRKSSVSIKLVVAGVIFTLVVAIDFLLVTNIVIYVRTLDPSDNSDIFSHTFIIILSLLAIWSTYRFCVWYIQKFKILASIQKNKLYQKLANEALELENLIIGEEPAKDE